MLSSLLLQSCSVKENRLGCPFELTVDLALTSRPAASGDSVEMVLGDPGGNLWKVAFTDSEKGRQTVRLQRGEVNICGMFNRRTQSFEAATGRVMIPRGCQSDSIYAFSYDVSFNGELMKVYPMLYKQWATLTILAENDSFFEDYFVRVLSSSAGFNLAGLSGVDGKYDFEPLPEEGSAKGRVSARVPRQKDSSLAVEVYQKNGGNRVCTFDVAPILAREGYDWGAPNLDDIEITVSALFECTLRITEAEWRRIDIGDISI